MGDLFSQEGLPKSSEPAGWAEFWQAYPRHTAKAAALKAWKKLKPSPALLETILESLRRFKAGPWRDRYGGLVKMEFIPHPSTWLCGKRWEDELPTAPDLEKLKLARMAAEAERRKKQTATEEEILKGRQLLQEWRERRKGSNDKTD
jgi:hypothetical protein